MGQLRQLHHVLGGKHFNPLAPVDNKLGVHERNAQAVSVEFQDRFCYDCRVCIQVNPSSSKSLCAFLFTRCQALSSDLQEMPVASSTSR